MQSCFFVSFKISTLLGFTILVVESKVWYVWVWQVSNRALLYLSFYSITSFRKFFTFSIDNSRLKWITILNFGAHSSNIPTFSLLFAFLSIATLAWHNIVQIRSLYSFKLLQNYYLSIFCNENLILANFLTCIPLASKHVSKFS